MTADSNEPLTGAQRAAIFLLSIGETDAAQVLKHLQAHEVQEVGTAMAGMKKVRRNQLSEVLAQFTQEVDENTSLGMGTDEYIRKLLVSALGENKAGGLIDRILLGRNSKGLESLKWMDNGAIAELIGQEHPQIIALVLSHLEPEQAAAVVSHLPARSRGDVIMRIATLDGVQPHAIHELEEIIENQFSGQSKKLKSSSMGGLTAAAGILNAMESQHENEIIEAIRGVDEPLSQQIEELMFVFDDLNKMDNRSMQTLLREVPSEQLVVALKGADQSIREKVFSNMSKRASDMLREDLEAKGPVRLSDVEAAQKEILTIAKRLSDEGQINLGGSSGGDFV